MSTASSHHICTPGLAEAVAACAPSPSHEALVRAIRAFAGWENAKVVTQRGDMWQAARRVLSPDGKLVSDDHQQWLADQVAANGGNVAATRRQLAGEGYLLTQTDLVSLFVVCDRGGVRPEDFVQMVVWVQDEYVDRELFAGYVGLEPEDLRDLLHELGEPLAQRKRYAPTRYRAEEHALDVGLFVRELVEADSVLQARAAARIVQVTDDNGGRREATLAEMFPQGVRRFAPNGKRIFDDWLMSSAGRSGARFCDHWVLTSATEYADQKAAAT